MAFLSRSSCLSTSAKSTTSVFRSGRVRSLAWGMYFLISESLGYLQKVLVYLEEERCVDGNFTLRESPGKAFEPFRQDRLSSWALDLLVPFCQFKLY
ncbi:hypothetical protein BpHYR1_014915 [Brachionus plicatilis]|uniref:Uncharacterized protein n=1 Tax=Brachionus plicatilis TaxID=10195 RepID=A0A3M7R9A0_BRAPC|nr:hypothetical protein BpHYR1_014915 [Brachionus plicatilis]